MTSPTLLSKEQIAELRAHVREVEEMFPNEGDQTFTRISISDFAALIAMAESAIAPSYTARPREPNEAMLDAAREWSRKFVGSPIGNEAATRCWQAMYDAFKGGFECKAHKQGTAGGNDPADCDWPVCGCDSTANKVIASLEESGWLTTKDDQ